jgi:flagellar basal-body rod protein FlgB
MDLGVMLDPIATRLEQYLDLLSHRQKLVATNIANLDTPGYRTRDIDFNFEFVSSHPGSKPHVIEPGGLRTNNDGNNVSMDREARLLAENALRFNVASNLLRGQVQMLRRAMEEGRA